MEVSMARFAAAFKDTTERRTENHDKACIELATQTINSMIEQDMRPAHIAYVGVLMFEFALTNLNADTMKKLLALKNYFENVRDAIISRQSIIQPRDIN
jgi:hypothetical protein